MFLDIEVLVGKESLVVREGSTSVDVEMGLDTRIYRS